VFEGRKVDHNSKENLTEMYEDGNLKHRIGIYVYQFSFEVVEEVVEEVTARKPKSLLEVRLRHHDFLGVGSRYIFTLGWLPLEHCTRRQQVEVLDSQKLVLVNFISHMENLRSSEVYSLALGAADKDWYLGT
jgi:hypothetical protein